MLNLSHPPSKNPLSQQRGIVEAEKIAKFSIATR